MYQSNYTMTQLQNRDRRSVRSDGRPTGIVVEDAIWDRLKLIAFERGVSMSKLIGEIERTLRFDPPVPGRRRVRSLSSAVRIFVFEHMDAAASGDAIERALAIAANRQTGSDTKPFASYRHVGPQR
jgi:predicted DNA-binding ribbon-helix-helix protein